MGKASMSLRAAALAAATAMVLGEFITLLG